MNAKLNTTRPALASPWVYFVATYIWSGVFGGLAILIGLVRELDIPLVQPIEAGLRMGVMWDLHLRSTKRDRRDLAQWQRWSASADD